MMRMILLAVILSLFVVGAGCSKESNVVAPSPSTITVTALPSGNVLTGNTVFITAIVTDSDGKAMNGIGVRFLSSNTSVASFSSTAAVGQTSANTDSSGVATITVYAKTAGTADISADISTTSGMVSVTVN